MRLITSTIVAFLLVQYQYSQTSLKWPSWGQIKGSITERRPLWEGRGVMWHLLFLWGDTTLQSIIYLIKNTYSQIDLAILISEQPTSITADAWFAVVNVDLTVTAIKTLKTNTSVSINLVNTCSIVLTWQSLAVVNVLFTILTRVTR